MQHPVATEKTLNDSLRLLENVDLRDYLPTLTLPFLRLYGKLDTLVPKAAIEKIDSLLPHSQKYVFNKASHAPFISDPDEFNEILLSWCIKHVIQTSH
jgi:pimeloyl-[acyl-carrier protein] methyl ester esterase